MENPSNDEEEDFTPRRKPTVRKKQIEFIVSSDSDSDRPVIVEERKSTTKPKRKLGPRRETKNICFDFDFEFDLF